MLPFIEFLNPFETSLRTKGYTMNLDSLKDVKESNVHIAPATPDDVWDMQDVFYYGWLATYPNAEHGITVDDIEHRYQDRHSEETLAKRRERIAHPPEGEVMLVARDGDTMVGLCRVIKHHDRNQLQAIYVLPEYHGRGIGTALWKAAQACLDPTKHCIVEVVTYNAKAIKFYESLGFTDTGKRFIEQRLTLKSGATLPEMEMRREVKC